MPDNQQVQGAAAKPHKMPLETSLFLLGAGAFGFFFRWIQLEAGFNDDNLPDPSIWNWILPLSVLGLAWYYRRIVRSYAEAPAYLPHGLTKTLGFSCRFPILYDAPRYLAALLIGVGSIVLIMTTMLDKSAMFWRAVAVCGILTAIALPLIQSEANGHIRHVSAGVLRVVSVFPILFMAVWLVTCYQTNATNSVVWSYVVDVAVICSCMMMFFRLAGIFYGQQESEKLQLWVMISSYLCFTALADSRNLGLAMILLGLGLECLVLNWVTVANLVPGRPPKKRSAPKPAPVPPKSDGGFEQL